MTAATKRYAVFGVLDSHAAAVVRPLQHRLVEITGNNLALRFPVHVTPALLQRLSGDDLALPELRSPADLTIAERVAAMRS